MSIPNLMPNQFEPFNGDRFVSEKIKELRRVHKLNTAVETGTCLGGTTKFLSDTFDNVHTIEINKEWQSIAIDHCHASNVNFVLGDSGEQIYNVCPLVENDTLFFLDSHWGNNLPLLKELNAIAINELKPVIAIHDFYVPTEHKLNFDTYNNQKLEFEFISSHLDQIYGIGGYEYSYNSYDLSEFPHVGLIFITPIV